MKEKKEKRKKTKIVYLIEPGITGFFPFLVALTEFGREQGLDKRRNRRLRRV